MQRDYMRKLDLLIFFVIGFTTVICCAAVLDYSLQRVDRICQEGCE